MVDAVLRPALHLTAGGGWLNDPLGLTYRDGTYHLFFQYVPGGREWAPGCSWGHATSPDLLSWTEGPVALAPGEGDEGCWSGSVVTPAGGAPLLFYTSVAGPDLALGRVRTARPADADLAVWRKDDGVVAEPPLEPAAAHFRDPFVFADGGRWWMLVGAGLPDGTATALASVSDDLVSWRTVGPVASRHRDEADPVLTGSVWECPQLLRVGERHVLVVSVWDSGEPRDVACAVGRFAEGRFHVEAWHRLTWGPSHYAASAFTDRDGRPGLLFWLRGMADAAGTWTGAVSLPYLLDLAGDRPVLRPHDALDGRRAQPRPSAALDLTWRPVSAEAELRLVDEEGGVLARVRRAGDRLTVDGGAQGPVVAAPYTGGELRLVLDGPVLELAGTTGVLALPVTSRYATARPEASGEAELAWWALEVPAGSPAGRE